MDEIRRGSHLSLQDGVSVVPAEESRAAHRAPVDLVGGELAPGGQIFVLQYRHPLGVRNEELPLSFAQLEALVLNVRLAQLRMQSGVQSGMLPPDGRSGPVSPKASGNTH